MTVGPPPFSGLGGSAAAPALERRLAALLNAAYGPMPEDVELLWRSAPPRMPAREEET